MLALLTVAVRSAGVLVGHMLAAAIVAAANNAFEWFWSTVLFTDHEPIIRGWKLHELFALGDLVVILIFIVAGMIEAGITFWHGLRRLREGDWEG